MGAGGGPPALWNIARDCARRAASRPRTRKGTVNRTLKCRGKTPIILNGGPCTGHHYAYTNVYTPVYKCKHRGRGHRGARAPSGENAGPERAQRRPRPPDRKGGGTAGPTGQRRSASGGGDPRKPAGGDVAKRERAQENVARGPSAARAPKELIPLHGWRHIRKENTIPA